MSDAYFVCVFASQLFRGFDTSLEFLVPECSGVLQSDTGYLDPADLDEFDKANNWRIRIFVAYTARALPYAMMICLEAKKCWENLGLDVIQTNRSGLLHFFLIIVWGCFLPIASC